MQTTRALGAAVLAALVATAACTGGGDGGAAPGSTAAAAPAPAAPSSGPDPAVDPPEAGASWPDAAFYEWPDPRPAGLPGQVLRAQERPAPPGARAWTVLYLSEGVGGGLVPVSGMVVAPDGPPPREGRTVVSWAHGTVGSADPCAPSRAPSVEVPALEALLEAGFVVAATDYEGLGTPGPHPYLVGSSEARGVLDAARAAGQLPEAAASGRVVVWGHSQGGHAALFAAQEAPTYAPELVLLGVAATAPAATPSALVATTAESPLLGAFHLLAAAGLSVGRPDLRLDDVLSPAGRALLPRVEEHCLERLFVEVVARGEPVGRPGPVPSGGWAEVLAANDVGGVPVAVPVRLDQGDADAVVPAALTTALAERSCRAGVVVELRLHAGADHTGVLGRAGAEVVGWLGERARGAPAPTTC